MSSKLARQKMRELAQEVALELKKATGNTSDVEDLVITAHNALVSFLPIEFQNPDDYMRFVLYLTIARISLVGGITDNAA
jgi:hypothetical protein